MAELFSPQDELLLPVFDAAINVQIAKHIGKAANGVDLNALDDSEFVELAQASERQPLKPLATLRSMLGYDESATVADVMGGIREEDRKLRQLYVDNGIDPTDALRESSDIINLTEGNIDDYSRTIGVFAFKIMATLPGAKGFWRWNKVLWVPEEDGHRDTLTIDRLARDEGTDQYDADHIRFNQIGSHPTLESLFSTAGFVLLQEGATGPSYDNWAALRGPVLREAPLVIGDQEVFHTSRYSGAFQAIARADPDRAAIELEHEIKTFDMPGRDGIRDYDKREMDAAMAGLLDKATIKDVARKTIKRIGFEKMTFRTKEGSEARDRLLDPSGHYSASAVDKKARRMDSFRQRFVEAKLAAGELMPAILGVTVVAHPVTGELSFPMSK